MSHLTGLATLFECISWLRPCEGEFCDIVISARVRKSQPVLNLWNSTIDVLQRSRPDAPARGPNGGISVFTTLWLTLLLRWYRGHNVLIPARIAVINGHTTVLLYAPKRPRR